MNRKAFEQYEFRYRNIQVEGIGLGGIESCYALPEFMIGFDIGRCPEFMIEIPVIFLSHGHLDHAAGIPYYFSQRSLRNLPAARVYAPAEIVEPLNQILQLWHDIEGFQYEAKVQPILPGQRVQVGPSLYVQALSSFHRVSSLGYVLLQQSSKLKPEYLSLPGEEVRKLREAKADIFEVREVPLFAYSGDSTIEFVLENPLAAQARVLLLECTYIDDKRPIERARKWGHIHLYEIIQHAHLLHNEKLVLVHFSRRYGKKQVRQILREKMPASLYDKTDLMFGRE